MLEPCTRHQIWQLLAILEFEVIFAFRLQISGVDVHLLAHI